VIAVATMPSLRTLLCAAVFAITTSAQNDYNGGSYQAPAVAAAAAAMADANKQYITYSGAAASGAPNVAILAKTKTKTSSAAPTPTGACSYWLDEIKHQGVAAFNDDTSMSYMYRTSEHPD
jgi:hypothetical protein